MHITASAPGKLVLLGEYAVLEGAPALVLAVNRRARVTLDPLPGDRWDFVSPTLGVQGSMRIQSSGVEWCGTPPRELQWLAALFEQLAFAATLPPCRIELDSDAFHLREGAEPMKLGLGSSAALTVALLGGLHALARQPPPSLPDCIAVHRKIQHGRGSGIDTAASLAGGLSRFHLADGAPHCAPMQLPEGLRWRCVFSGRPASTGAMLSTMAAWREREPPDYARRINELATISSRGVDAVVSHDAAAFLSSLDDYAQALARLGEASGVEIASRGHRALGSIAAGCGTVYKSCGAGGGDVGVTLSMDDTRLREFAARAARAGFPVVGMDGDPQGLETNVVA